MIEMIWSTGDEVNKTTEDQLKAEGMMSEYYFNSDGSFFSNYFFHRLLFGWFEYDFFVLNWQISFSDEYSKCYPCGTQKDVLQTESSAEGFVEDLKSKHEQGNAQVPEIFRKCMASSPDRNKG